MLDEIAENFLRATAHDPQALVPWATVPYFENTAVRHSVKVCAITLENFMLFQ